MGRSLRRHRFRPNENEKKKIDCYFRLGEIFASGNNSYPGIEQNFKAARKQFEYAREESDLSKDARDKLPEGVWQRVLNDPLSAKQLILSYQRIIGAPWRGSIGDLNPEKLRKIIGVDYDSI